MLIRIIIYGYFIAIAFSCEAQTVQQEIDRDVWYPFIASYDAFDADAFMAIHTDDVLRIVRDGQMIQSAEEYALSMQESSKRNIELKSIRHIDFSFVERFHNDDTAFEVGYYKVIYSSNDAERVSFGQFQVVLKKIDGIWKIAVDSDTSNDGSIGEADFNSGKKLPER